MTVTCGRCGTVNAGGLRCRECGDHLLLYRTAARPKRSGLPLFLAIAVLSIVALVGGAALLSTAFKIYYAASDSMGPTIGARDALLVSRIAYARSAPNDGDIVVFDPPIEIRNPFIKRIVAKPGERLRIRAGRVYRNGVALKESYIADPTGYDLEIKNYGIYVDGTPLDRTQANIPPREKWSAPDTVPFGCYIVMGDNRNNSEDSHIWGFAQSGERLYSGPEAGHEAGEFAKVVYIVFPSARAGRIR